MDPESIERYTAMAKQLNVTQGELINFIRDQLKDDREARRLQREQEKKEKLEEEERIEKRRRDEERVKEEKRVADEERNHRLQLEAEKQKMEAEERKERLRLEVEKSRADEEARKEQLRVEAEKLRVDEEERKERLRMEEEARKERLKAEEDERNRQFQLEEMRIKENARDQQDQRELEMVRIRAQGQNNTDQNIEQNGGGRDRRKFVIEIGTWNHEVTDWNTFLCNFETNATALAVTGEMKALELTRCLQGSALELIQSLSQDLLCRKNSDVPRGTIGSSLRRPGLDLVKVRSH